MSGDGEIRVVFLDIGGVMYDDSVYARSWARALRESGAVFTDREFDAEYSAARAAQAGSFRRRLTSRFLGPDADIEPVEAIAKEHSAYPPGRACTPTCCPASNGWPAVTGWASSRTSRAWCGRRWSATGIDRFMEVWGVSDDVGLAKPNPRFFAHVLSLAGEAPPHAVMVGDRLDYDVRPARRAGMRTVWVLRGEAPDDPTPRAARGGRRAIRGLDELPDALERI